MANILNISGTEIKDRGIQKLADYVEANLPDDFTLVIGCKPSIYDVDAVLIGKGNIYTIECKDWKGNIKGGSYGWWQKDSQVIDNPLHQARNNAAALGKWLRDKIKRKAIWVRGLVVFTHQEAELNIDIDKNSNTAISVLNINSLNEWIGMHNHNTKGFENEKEIVMLFSSHEERKENVPDEVQLHIINLIVVVVFIIAMFILNTKSGVISLFAAILGIPLLRKYKRRKVIESSKSIEVSEDMVSKHKSKYRKTRFDEIESIDEDPVFNNFVSNVYYSGDDLDE